MVDYALVLLPDETMHRAILDVLRQSPDDEDHNINQTRSGPVRFRPITANIEVKVPGEGRNQTMVQLAVWVTAQFKKLNALTGGRGAVQEICIPLISVEGHDWRIYIAYQTADGEVVRLTLLCTCASSFCLQFRLYSICLFNRNPRTQLLSCVIDTHRTRLYGATKFSGTRRPSWAFIE
jgi:hypothetical protein